MTNLNVIFCHNFVLNTRNMQEILQRLPDGTCFLYKSCYINIDGVWFTLSGCYKNFFHRAASYVLQTEFLRNSVRYQHPGSVPGVDTAIPQTSSLLKNDLLLAQNDFTFNTEDVFTGKQTVCPVFSQKFCTVAGLVSLWIWKFNQIKKGHWKWLNKKLHSFFLMVVRWK